MHARTLAAIAALALVPAGCVSVGAPGPGPTAVMPAPAFAAEAAMADTFEIRAGAVALDRSRNRAVRSVARTMIQDHTRAGGQLARVVRREGRPPVPVALDARHRAMIAELRTMPAAVFDGRYLAMQAEAHREAIDLYAGYAAHGDDPALRAFAADTLPVLDRHARLLGRITGTAPAVVGRR